MPTDVTSFAGAPSRTATEVVSLEPVYHQLQSLSLLYQGEKMPGLAEWVGRTREMMPLEQLQRNRLVMEGLCYSFTTVGDLPSFGAYLDRLEGLPAQSFQDRLLSHYLATTRDGCTMRFRPPTESERREILASVDSYLDFITKRFSAAYFDPDVEAQAYRYAADPAAMKALIVDHLRQMWETYLAPEWARIRPMLTRTVAAFRSTDLSEMPRLKAVQTVIGRDTAELHWGTQLEEAERVLLVPSAHIGPYVRKFVCGRDLVILFGAHLPEGAGRDEPDVSRTDMLTRLDALSDDHRLRILRMAADAGEVRATDVMTALDISQSAASRSLTQLTATGYLVESRREGGKCYSINEDRIRDTLGALARFLGVSAKDGTV